MVNESSVLESLRFNCLYTEPKKETQRFNPKCFHANTRLTENLFCDLRPYFFKLYYAENISAISVQLIASVVNSLFSIFYRAVHEKYTVTSS